MLWVLDDGHGKQTKGKRSPDLDIGILEYEFNQDITARIQEILGDAIKTELLAPGDDAIPLRERIKRLKELKEMHGQVALLSVHANAAAEDPNSPYFDGVLDGWTGARGSTTFHHPNAVDNGKLADIIETFYRSFTDIKSRGVKTANFQLLRGANMLGIPSALHECAFMTNMKNAMMMKSHEGRDIISKALSAGLIEADKVFRHWFQVRK